MWTYFVSTHFSENQTFSAISELGHAGIRPETGSQLSKSS